jgi:hypothetical protein
LKTISLFYRIAGFAGLTGFYFVLLVNPVILLILSIEEPSYNKNISNNKLL